MKMPLIIRGKGSATGDIIEEYLQKQLGVSLSYFNVICEMESAKAIKEAILAGLGVSILSTFVIKRELPQGSLTALHVNRCNIVRYLHLIYKKQFHLLICHKHFLDIVKRYSPPNEAYRGVPKNPQNHIFPITNKNEWRTSTAYGNLTYSNNLYNV